MKSNYANQLKNAREKNAIRWIYSGSGDGIPAESVVRLGDIDPMTGEPITDVSWFHEYRKQTQREIYHNLKNAHGKMADSSEEKKQKEEEKERIRQAFEAEYGYCPSADTLEYLYEEKHPDSWVYSTDLFFKASDRSGDDELEDLTLRDPAAEAAYGLDESDAVYRMREYAESLNPRQRDIYQAMLMKYQGGGIWITNQELAEKWGVSVTMIRKEQARIEEGIKKAVRR